MPMLTQIRLQMRPVISLEPGQTMTLVFNKPSKADPATGISETTQVPFWCDIHSHMKGEFLVVETKGEVGGG